MDALAHSAALERRLGELIELLESRAAPDVLARALAEVEQGFAALRAAPSDREDPARSRAVRQRLTRLHAVAHDLAAGYLDDLDRGLTRVRDARSHLGALRADPSTGGSCDIAG